MKTYEIKTRCHGEPCQYHTLRLFVDGVAGAVHTSKSMSYLMTKVPAGYQRRTN